MTLLRIGAPRRALIIAPHADDEVIGAFGLIWALRRRGTRVGILIVSDGAGSHRNSVRWPKARLVAERRRETRRAMRRLGIMAGDILQLGLPDGELSGSVRLGPAIGRAVRRARAGLIVTPAATDAHPDHRAVAAAIARMRVAARRISYRVWPDPSRRIRPARLTVPLGHRLAAKRLALRTYRTQLGIITDDPGGFAISRGEFAAFTAPREYYAEERRCGG